MKDVEKVSFTIPKSAYQEFEKVARQIGFAQPSDLLVTYIRDVIISARIDNATSSLRETVARGSNDLDELLRKPVKRPSA